MSAVLDPQAVARALLEDGLTLHLYANDVYPEEGKPLPVFVETGGGGYRPIDLPADGWDVNSHGKARFREVGWQFTGSVGKICGSYLTRKGVVLGAARFERMVDAKGINRDYANVRLLGTIIRVVPELELSVPPELLTK